MTFDDIIRALSCTVVVRGTAFETAGIKSLVSSDLMSDVLTTTEEDFIISTSLNSEQVVRTADIVGALGIVLVNGKYPQDAMRRLAEEHGITLLSTPMDAYRVCFTLGCAMESRGRASP